MESSWGLALCEAIEDAASVVVEGPGLKGSLQRNWGLAPRREPMRGNWWQCSPVAARDSSVLEMPVTWDDHQEQQHELELTGAYNWCLQDELCVLQRAEPEKRPKPFGGAQKIKVIGHWVTHAIRVWFCLVPIVTVPWFFLLEEAI